MKLFFRPFHTISKMDSLLCILKKSVDFLSLVNCFPFLWSIVFLQSGASLNPPPPPSNTSSSSRKIVALFLDIIFKFGTFTNLKALFQQQIDRGQLTQPSYNVKKKKSPRRPSSHSRYQPIEHVTRLAPATILPFNIVCRQWELDRFFLRSKFIIDKSSKYSN